MNEDFFETGKFMRIFKNTLNTRPILKNSLRYIRSDIPTDLSHNEIKWLLSNDITTIVDLRTKEERLSKHCPLADDTRFSYVSFEITGGNNIPKTPSDVSKSYINMVDEKFNELIEFLLNANSNVLYFCNAGKDRTGVVSAALLYNIGESVEYIVDDYMKSKANLKLLLEKYARQYPSINIDVITPHRQYIEKFLKWYAEYKKVK